MSCRDMSADVIEGKGNGLTILLHGGPGTGKTLRAESVAELAEKPLYRVTCGDIRTDAEAVEKYLESVLHIGTIWKAGTLYHVPQRCIKVADGAQVALFDENDVFQEERSQADLQRNALVSVFLRVLEYYDGILILTSNRGESDSTTSAQDITIQWIPIDIKHIIPEVALAHPWSRNRLTLPGNVVCSIVWVLIDSRSFSHEIFRVFLNRLPLDGTPSRVFSLPSIVPFSIHRAIMCPQIFRVFLDRLLLGETPWSGPSLPQHRCTFHPTHHSAPPTDACAPVYHRCSLRR